MSREDDLKLIATLPPYVSHKRLIAEHSDVSALRFNTIMPIAEDKVAVLRDLKAVCGHKPLWIDLKGRQLRITQFAYLPYAFVELSRKIRREPPFDIYFKDCKARVTRVVGGDKLILDDRPERVVGRGEPVNINDAGVEGYLTNDDVEWIEAAKKLGLHDYMLSFCESHADIAQVREIDPEARIVAKIESLRGVEFARSGEYRVKCVWPTLMAARDDLFINYGCAGRPFEIIQGLKEIVQKDPAAICASRILTSFESGKKISMGDISDLALMCSLGYRNFMLSDGVCFKLDAFEHAIEAWSYFERDWQAIRV